MENISAKLKECPLCGKHSMNEEAGYCQDCGWEPSHFLDMPEETRQRYNKRFEIMKRNWAKIQELKGRVDAAEKRADKAKEVADKAKPIMMKLEADLNKSIREGKEKTKQINELQQSLNKSKADCSAKVQKLQLELENAQKNTVRQSDPPFDLVVNEDAGNSIGLKWSHNAEQDCQFIVLRKQGAAPASLNDGNILGCTNKAEWQDTALPKDVSFFYAIIAAHSKALSKPLYSGEIIIDAADLIPPVKNLVAQDRGNYIQLLWDWPGNRDDDKSIFTAQVSWRHDQYPESPHDSRAKSHFVLRSLYEQTGGFKIENPDERPYWFTVRFCNSNQKRFGPADQAKLNVGKT